MEPISPKTAPSASLSRPSTPPVSRLSFHALFQRLSSSSSSSAPPPGSHPPMGLRGPLVLGSEKGAQPEEDSSRAISPAAPFVSAVSLGGITPPLLPFVAPAEIHVVRTAMSMEQLLPDLVRRVAWGGDARRGTVRLELGRGALDGARITVHADGGRVSVELAGGDSAALHAFRERIDERLKGRGIDVDDVRVV